MRAFHKLSQGLRDERAKAAAPAVPDSIRIETTGVLAASPAQTLYMKKIKQHRRLVLFIQVFLLVFIIAAWEICSDVGLLNSFIFSSPAS